MEEQELEQGVVVPEATEVRPAGQVTVEDEGGSIQIADNVLRMIIRKFTLGVEGVVRFQNQSLMDGMFDILGKRSGEHGIELNVKDDGSSAVTVNVVLRFGVRIPDVAHEIQNVLRTNLEQLAGYSVTQVNVNVIDLEEEEPKPEAESEPEAAVAEPVAEEQPGEVPEAEKETAEN